MVPLIGQNEQDVSEQGTQVDVSIEVSLLEQWSPNFFAPGSGFVEDDFSMDPEDDSRALRLLFTLFLLLSHKAPSQIMRH